MLPVLEKYRAIIGDYTITVFEEAGSSFRLHAIVRTGTLESHS